MANTFGWLRQILTDQGITYRTDREDDELIPEHALGGDWSGLPRASEVGQLDLRAMLPPANMPELAVRRVATGLARSGDLNAALAESVHPQAADALAAARQAEVDWRNRFGRNWITTVRDQDGCGACWAFAATALVEAMVKVEHAYWVRLSEGDLHDGMGARCADGNNLSAVSDWLAIHGLADPGCWPWTTDDVLYASTPDRAGRCVRMPAFTWIGDLEQQKQWVDTTGPIATWFDVWHDFDGYRPGYVYHRSNDASNYERGGHYMLVVGYDDGEQAWICKNSWGSGWGDHGYALIGYGEAGIDDYAKAGLTGLDPDPWTKRRLHNGNLLESGCGTLHRNLEVVGATGGHLIHHWRPGEVPMTWKIGAGFGTDAAHAPTLTATTYNRNLEVIYRTTSGRLHHWWSPVGGAWNDGGIFGPAGCQSVPGFIQSDYGVPGNFEVVVKIGGDRLQHLWRDNRSGAWNEGTIFGSQVMYSGRSLVQSDYGSPHGNLELVAVQHDGRMRHYWRDAHDMTWQAGPAFGAGVAGPPVMIQGQYGMRVEDGPHGNFELCSVVAGRVEHWWRDNAGGSGAWQHSATFGHEVATVTGLAEGSWGMNLELIVQRTDGQLQHYWRDAGGVWHEGPVLGPA
jgi:hypothetical protein